MLFPSSWLECSFEATPSWLWFETWPEPGSPTPSGQAGPLISAFALVPECKWSVQVGHWRGLALALLCSFN